MVAGTYLADLDTSNTGLCLQRWEWSAVKLQPLVSEGVHPVRSIPAWWAALFAALTLISAGSRLHAQGVLQCGVRPAVTYALVLDVSSSMRNNRAEATDAYAHILSTLAGILCQGDSLYVYRFPNTDKERMQSVVSLTGPIRDREARAIAAHALDSGVRHTDLTMVLESIQQDLHTHATFIATDGSFYPADTDSIRINELQGRLNDLGALVQESADQQLYAIGVRSDRERAIDRELTVEDWPAGSSATWDQAGRRYDLGAIYGSDLLEAVFGERFFRYGDPWLHRLVFGRETPMWRHLGYERPPGVSLRDIQSASVEHLIFVPPDGREGMRCAELSSRQADHSVQRVSTDGSGRSGFCSIQKPTAAELGDLQAIGVTEFTYRQRPAFDLSSIPSTIYGFHQLIAGEHGQSCAHNDIRRYLQRGEPWPPTGPKVGTVEIRPISDGGVSKTLDLLKLPGTSCLVPRATAPYDWDVAGPHLVYFRSTAGTTVGTIELVTRRMVSGPSLRMLPGGFVLGNGSRLSTCVELSQPLGGTEALQLHLPGRQYSLTEDHDLRDCTLPGSSTSGSLRKRYVFSSVVAQASSIRSGYLLVGEPTDTLAEQPGSEWYPVSIRPDGKFYLSNWQLAVSFLLGAGVQLGIFVWGWSQRGWHTLSLKQGRHLAGRLLRAGFIGSICLGAVVAILSTHWEGVESVPTSLLMGVASCLMKLILAVYLPNLVDEGLSD